MDGDDDSELIVLAPMGTLDAYTAAEFRSMVAGLPTKPARVLRTAGLDRIVTITDRLQDAHAALEKTDRAERA